MEPGGSDAKPERAGEPPCELERTVRMDGRLSGRGRPEDVTKAKREIALAFDLADEFAKRTVAGSPMWDYMEAQWPYGYPDPGQRHMTLEERRRLGVERMRLWAEAQHTSMVGYGVSGGAAAAVGQGGSYVAEPGATVSRIGPVAVEGGQDVPPTLSRASIRIAVAGQSQQWKRCAEPSLKTGQATLLAGERLNEMQLQCPLANECQRDVRKRIVSDAGGEARRGQWPHSTRLNAEAGCGLGKHALSVLAGARRGLGARQALLTGLGGAAFCAVAQLQLECARAWLVTIDPSVQLIAALSSSRGDAGVRACRRLRCARWRRLDKVAAPSRSPKRIPKGERREDRGTRKERALTALAAAPFAETELRRMTHPTRPKKKCQNANQPCIGTRRQHQCRPFLPVSPFPLSPRAW
ncbi:hypothetical protein L1887_53630 [Cichorium endivia]|nr:hypothetical protein L1887_53630 [Cichorium endivia]